MSMLSTQVDKLRELAARFEELQVGAVKSVAVPSNMGSILRDAADTIWELRGSVNREWAEADRLREQLAKARDPQRIGGTADPESFVYAIEQLREFRWQHATNDEEAIPYINNVADAHERENAKLRELMYEHAHVYSIQNMTEDELRITATNVMEDNAKLRELCKELLDLCYDAYNQEWGWDDDWALAYERAKKLGVEVGK